MTTKSLSIHPDHEYDYDLGIHMTMTSAARSIPLRPWASTRPRPSIRTETGHRFQHVDVYFGDPREPRGFVDHPQWAWTIQLILGLFTGTPATNSF